MLSVVLYGRNDSHGYNLHKRAAISLNAIAELLTDPDDEILFVDYNTSDDLPTFPEAIADTLTDKAVSRLRILRVRSDVHRERFAGQTHLVALEPIARNAAIRRSNPRNRWVLSTNTDMIFCPRTDGADLTSIVAGLEDGFYHLPRFELPEGLWETLDRKDAPEIIGAARAWGQRFHLNEIVLADHDNLYDGPGDFQLFLREDLFKVGGFHEHMILGWHLDANIARRMRMLRGKVSSALDHLIGYHCDHTRQASAYHKVDRVENDSARFVDGVDRADIPGQMDSWGLADLDIEQFGLAEASAARFLRGLQTAVPQGGAGFLQTQYLLEDYGRMEYEPEHILPYLLDLLSCVPPDARVGYVGGRGDTLAGFNAGWRAMGGQPLLLTDTAPWLRADGAERASLDDWLDRTDIFVFDVAVEESRHHAEFTDDDRARLWAVDQAFKRAVDHDRVRRAEGAPPRRVVVINGVHNFFEHQMMTEVAVTLTPFSSRIRHGYFNDRATARAAVAGPDKRAVMQGLGAAEPPSTREIARMAGLLKALETAGDEDPAWPDAARAGTELEVYAAAGLIEAGDAGPDLLARVRALRPSARLPPQAQSLVDPAAGRGARSRLARVEDWDDLEWARLARKMFTNRDHADLFEREAWTWERVTLAQNLVAAVPPEGRPKVLVTGEHPERFAFAVANLGYEVDIADPRTLASGEPKAVDWRAEFLTQGWTSPAPVGLIDDRLAAIADGLRYDAVLIPQNGLFAAGRAAAADMLKAASNLLKPGGHLGLGALAQPVPGDDRRQEHALPLGLSEKGAFAAALQDVTDLDLDGLLDAHLTPRSLDRVTNAPERPSAAPPALITGAAPHFEVPGVWALRKGGGRADWAAFKRILDAGVYGGAVSSPPAAGGVSRLFAPEELVLAAKAKSAVPGDGFGALAPMPGVDKSPTALRASRSHGAALVATAAFGRQALGAYELEVEVHAPKVDRPGAVLAVGLMANGAVLAEEMLQMDQAGVGRLLLPVEIGQEGERDLSAVFKAQGLIDFDIVNIALR